MKRLTRLLRALHLHRCRPIARPRCWRCTSGVLWRENGPRSPQEGR